MVRTGTYAVPILPLFLVSAFYAGAPYHVGPLEVIALWIAGLAISYLLIAFHEAGHAIAARLLGIEIDTVTIGHWRKLLAFSLARVKIVVRAAPASGYVAIKPDFKRHPFWRNAIFLLAGVVAEGAVVGAVALTSCPATLLSFGDLLWAFARIDVVCIGGFQIFSNLLGRRGWVGGAIASTDVLQLRQLWKHREATPEQIQLLADLQECSVASKARDWPRAISRAQAIISRDPDNLDLLFYLGQMHLEAGDTAQAESIWRDLLKRPSLQPSSQARILDSLCCLALYDSRMDLLAEAEGWSAQALGISPHSITLKGTRGGVLIELGRIEEGIALLEEVMKRSECPLDHAISSAYLAKAHAQKGNREQSVRWLRKATELNPSHVVVERIARELAQRE